MNCGATAQIAALALFAFGSLAGIRGQSVQVTAFPAVGTSGAIEGFVTGASPASHRIAVVNEVFGSFWSKPTASEPSVAIRADGGFTATFITGGQDACAEKIHLFLVRAEETIPVTLGGGSVPPRLIELALAQATVDRNEGSALTFAGREWDRKHTAECSWGPGPNYFSRDQAWVDARGRLHLEIRHVNGQWRCAEVILRAPLGYGIYRFYLDSDLSNLPDSVVFGAFTYDEDPAFTHREIDIEFSNGVVVGRSAPWQYVIQPYQLPNQRMRFIAPPGMSRSMHSFCWVPGIVSFASYAAFPAAEDFAYEHKIQRDADLREPWTDYGTVTGRGSARTNILAEFQTPLAAARFFRTRLNDVYESGNSPTFKRWRTFAGVPPPRREKIHINLWLFNGMPPGADTTASYSVVVSSFEFTPLPPINGLNARLRMLEAAGGEEQVEVLLNQ